MKFFVKERTGKHTNYRFVIISGIQNDFLRRVLLLFTFPIFFSFNCISMLSVLPVMLLLSNVGLVRGIIKRWKEPHRDVWINFRRGALK